MSREKPYLESERVIVRFGTHEDAREVARFYRENDEFIGKTQNRATADHLDELSIIEALAFRSADYLADRSCRMFVFARDDREVIGTVNLNAFVRGYFQACYLGYAIAERHQKRGLMSEAVGLLLDFAFGELGLHRVMANYTPDNPASGRLLARLGFRIEGYAPRYLKIHGRWRDHVLTALTAEEHALRRAKQRG